MFKKKRKRNNRPKMESLACMIVNHNFIEECDL